jgi:phosphoribosylformimino-5-aminoimidazole carboxamide ribotide isomerase
MIIFPAIDIKDGQVVRLLQGDFDQVTEYARDPLAIAREWVSRGAGWLHLVDLDGARTGNMRNREIIIKIARAAGVPVETGGGVRGEEDIAGLVDGGVRRVILSTKAIEDRAFLTAMLRKYGDKIAVSLDCKDGRLTQRGWVDTTNIKAAEFVKELEHLGVSWVIYTDIARDGMLTGPNLERLEEILSVTKIPVIASGGVATIGDIRELKKLEPRGLLGAITGKALYEGTLDLEEALRVAGG